MLRIPNLEKRILSYVVEHEDVLAVQLDLLAEDFVVDHDQPVPLGYLVQRQWNVSAVGGDNQIVSQGEKSVVK